ncbi:MAG: hypothetical protein AAF403_07160, partial [Pseudomonadota bacterium]
AGIGVLKAGGEIDRDDLLNLNEQIDSIKRLDLAKGQEIETEVNAQLANAKIEGLVNAGRYDVAKSATSEAIEAGYLTANASSQTQAMMRKHQISQIAQKEADIKYINDNPYVAARNILQKNGADTGDIGVMLAAQRSLGIVGDGLEVLNPTILKQTVSRMNLEGTSNQEKIDLLSALTANLVGENNEVWRIVETQAINAGVDRHIVDALRFQRQGFTGLSRMIEAMPDDKTSYKVTPAQRNDIRAFVSDLLNDKPFFGFFGVGKGRTFQAVMAYAGEQGIEFIGKVQELIEKRAAQLINTLELSEEDASEKAFDEAFEGLNPINDNGMILLHRGLDEDALEKTVEMMSAQFGEGKLINQNGFRQFTYIADLEGEAIDDITFDEADLIKLGRLAGKPEKLKASLNAIIGEKREALKLESELKNINAKQASEAFKGSNMTDIRGGSVADRKSNQSGYVDVRIGVN